jgi:endoglucanase
MRVVLLATVLTILPVEAATKVEFWSVQRKGANFFNEVESPERLKAAAQLGVQWIRLAPDKWKGKKRDFLMGDADYFVRLVPEDVAQLRAILDEADKLHLKVVLTAMTLPGLRYKLKNGDQRDFRLYREPRYQTQAVNYWRDLAAQFAEHPAIVGYNIVNEPHPELDDETADFDLSGFYERVVAAIREVDQHTPVILDSGNFGSIDSLLRMRPIADPLSMYSVHFYEPWPYANYHNAGIYLYPGSIPVEEGSKEKKEWDRTEINKAMQPIADWMAMHNIPVSRVMLGEFGVPRLNRGAAKYLSDVIASANQRGFHWAFYAFREDTWHMMDYELGSSQPDVKFLAALKAGKQPDKKRIMNPIWSVIVNAIPKPAPAAKAEAKN